MNNESANILLSRAAIEDIHVKYISRRFGEEISMNSANDKRKARFEKRGVVRTIDGADVEIGTGPCWVDLEADSVLVHWQGPSKLRRYSSPRPYWPSSWHAESSSTCLGRVDPV